MVAQYARSCPLDARPALTEVKPPGWGSGRSPADAGRRHAATSSLLLYLDELLALTQPALEVRFRRGGFAPQELVGSVASALDEPRVAFQIGKAQQRHP